LSLGGLDPSGGAGLTVDAVVAAACGVDALPIAVALTAQNGRGFAGFEVVPAACWQAAASMQLEDGPVGAAKVGFVGDAAQVRAVAAFVRSSLRDVPLVVDPVLGATTGGFTASNALCDAYRHDLLPLATLCTPNVPELQALFGGDALRALASGCGAVLCKGGHGDGPAATDVLSTPTGRRSWERARLDVGEVRGTGCTLATAIAAHLACGDELEIACELAGDRLARWLAALGPATPGSSPRRLRFPT
jgi:hydroxymethylpyrimidine/phosphomethylpyrimidine kinase